MEEPNIKLLKMVSGETLVSEISINEDEGNVKLFNPIQVSIVRSRRTNTGYTIQISKWLPTDEKEFDVVSSNIVTMAQPTEELLYHYNDKEVHDQLNEKEPRENKEVQSTDGLQEEIEKYLEYLTTDKTIH